MAHLCYGTGDHVADIATMTGEVANVWQEIADRLTILTGNDLLVCTSDSKQSLQQSFPAGVQAVLDKR